MRNDIMNSMTLAQVGIRLLPGEQLAVAVDLMGGLTEELEPRRATLLLTNKRLVRYLAGRHKNNVVSVSLADVNSIEVNRSDKNRQWVRVGSVFVAGGILLGVLSFLLMSSPATPLLMALSLTLIGIVFILTYAGGQGGEVIVSVGPSSISSKMHPKALEDMAVFVQQFYELKLGASSGATPSGAPAASDKVGSISPGGLAQKP